MHGRQEKAEAAAPHRVLVREGGAAQRARPERQRHLVVEAERAEVPGFELRHHRPGSPGSNRPPSDTQCDDAQVFAQRQVGGVG
jgi:hypothetical protein